MTSQVPATWKEYLQGGICLIFCKSSHLPDRPGRAGNQCWTLVLPFGPPNNHQALFPVTAFLTRPPATFSPACPTAVTTLASSLSLQRPALTLLQGLYTARFLCLEPAPTPPRPCHTGTCTAPSLPSSDVLCLGGLP